jgi:hypothetical protein
MSFEVDPETVEWLECIQEYKGLTPMEARKPIFESGNSPLAWNIDGTENPYSSSASFAATSNHFS